MKTNRFTGKRMKREHSKANPPLALLTAPFKKWAQCSAPDYLVSTIPAPPFAKPVLSLSKGEAGRDLLLL